MRSLTETRMTRSLLVLLATATLLTVPAATPSSASAGGYDVIACNPSLAGGVNHSWTPLADVGMTAYTDCPSGQGIMARNVYDGAASSFLQGAYMILDAPPGTSVDSISFEAGMRRPDCNWSAQLVASNGDLGGTILFGLPAGQSCGSPFSVDENTYFAGRFSYGVGASRIRIEARCGAASCTRNGVASFHMRNVDVRIRDDVAPSLARGRGTLWTTDGWLAGTQSIGFNASDGAGIQSASVSVDGREVVHHVYPCDYTYVTPCSQAMVNEPLPTAGFGGDGAHTLTLSAVDGAGNPASASRTVRIDNTPPDAPQGLAVEGGDGWRSTNDFNITWKLSPVTTGSPIAGALWDLCPVDGGPCTHGSASGAGLVSLQHFKLPAPGAYTLKLWLRDAAGNQDPRLSAPPVTLRFDDASPTAAFAPPDPNDPTLVAVDTTDRGSGVVAGQISMRRRGAASWLALPTTVTGGRVVAHIDDERLGDGDFEFQASVSDAAGNQRVTTQRADGTAEIVTLPLRLKIAMRSGVVVRHGRRAHLARSAYAKYGQLVRVRGTLKSPEGNPLQDVEVQAWTQIKDGVTPPRLIATVKTSRKGAFSFLVRKGPSRFVKIRYNGTTQIRGVTKNLSLNVRSATSIRSNHKRVVNGETIRLHGRIRTGRIPPTGKAVSLQVWLRGKWRTFDDTRAGQRGTWSYNYRFDGTRGRQTYRFRAKVTLETGYPFATGRSRVVRVHVRGT